MSRRSRIRELEIEVDRLRWAVDRLFYRLLPEERNIALGIKPPPPPPAGWLPPDREDRGV